MGKKSWNLALGKKEIEIYFGKIVSVKIFIEILPFLLCRLKFESGKWIMTWNKEGKLSNYIEKLEFLWMFLQLSNFKAKMENFKGLSDWGCKMKVFKLLTKLREKIRKI